jgi:histidinol-phosphate aminotransferase
MRLTPRNAIAKLKPCTHGGIDYEELRKLNISPDDIIDFSANLNPCGFPPGIRPLVKSVRLSRYPDFRSMGLKQMIARRTGLSPENIIAGNGSTELIRLAATTYLDETDCALMIEPTYGEYRVACEIAGARVVVQRLSARNDFKPDIGTTLELIKLNSPKVIFLCNPNNPTGSYINHSEFMQILAARPEALVVLDEAYISFVSHPWSSLDLLYSGNLLVVRSMTKDYAIAGLRLGYACANREIIETLSRVCPPWNVNVAAQHAGIVALQQEKFLQESCDLAFSGKQYLIESIENMGWRCLPSRANFFLVRVGDASQIRSALLSRGILVRDCTSFGLPEYIRIAPATLKKNRRLVEAFAEIKAGARP